MSDTGFDTLLAFFKAMANESRLRIVGLIAERERSVQELADLLGLKEPTVSHHLSALKALGLSLEQIKQMLDDDLTTEQIRGMLRLKQAEAQQRVHTRVVLEVIGRRNCARPHGQRWLSQPISQLCAQRRHVAARPVGGRTQA